ncbi:MAG TPA: flagellar basal body rod protein FlgB [Chloroflexota bacterium]|nr:flagellar basal body rod protein FlgB [Chloroflexota bacterium]
MEIATSSSDRLIQAALNGLSARQRVIADNVANVDTPGFKASHVDFETALKRAQGGDPSLRLLGYRGDGRWQAPDASSLEPTVTVDRSTRREDGNNVDVDQQMLEMADANITYNALSTLTSARFGILRTVINEGRR